MDWTKVTKSLSSDYRGNDDAAVLSRRDVLAGIGFAGVIAVAGSTLLASTPAEGRTNAPAIEPEAAPPDAAKAEVAESNVATHDLADFDAADFTEFSAQWRRRYWRRRYWVVVTGAVVTGVAYGGELTTSAGCTPWHSRQPGDTGPAQAPRLVRCRRAPYA
jgi:hypothetical protein